MTQVVPTRRLAGALAGAAVLAAAALLAGVPLAPVMRITALGLALLAAAAALDLWRARRAWRAAPPQLVRRLPAALALGVRREIALAVDNPGPRALDLVLFDHPDGRLEHQGLPLALRVPPAARAEARYTVRPAQRGTMLFEPAEARVATPWRLFEWQRRLGPRESLRVYPDFAKVARYAWLAGDRRLAELGIKNVVQRGQGTDFRELADYRVGDEVRHLDAKASLRHRRPIVRRFQDDRDQCVMFLLDCGRRMRAAEDDAHGLGHFDHALDATLLLAYVALAGGDAVGAMTYGAAPGEARFVPPLKGRRTLHTLVAALHAVQPQPVQADIQQAAAGFMRRQGQRCLVVVVTNFRDEDADEVAPALALLRTRHLVLLASLREAALSRAVGQPLLRAAAAREVAAAHALEQARRDAFARLAARDLLLVDTEPAALPAALVNRYHAVKRAGLL